jgi:hypothetical protein
MLTIFGVMTFMIVSNAHEKRARAVAEAAADQAAAKEREDRIINVEVPDPAALPTTPPDFSTTRVVASSESVHPLETIDFDVILVNRGGPATHEVEVKVAVPTSVLFAGAGEGWKFDPSDRSIAWHGFMQPSQKPLRFSFVVLPETEGNLIAPGVAIRHAASETWIWSRVPIDTKLATPAFRMGRYGVTRAGVVFMSWLAITLLAIIAAKFVVGFSRRNVPRLPLTNTPVLVSGVALTCIASGFLIFFVAMGRDDYRMLNEWTASKGTVLDTLAGDESQPVANGSRRTKTSKPLVALRYETTQGQMISVAVDSPSTLRMGSGNDTAKTLAVMHPGSTVPCWYDPRDPKRVVFRRGFGGAYLFALIPLGVLAFALPMLLHGLLALRRRPPVAPDKLPDIEEVT